ncbi:asparagine synthetase [glutamine-hydrolyzing] [Diabrotica virgifera virgifera]|uniref:Asparagine synthetase [glutamine-hydrolyzing] n=1 Tax=Diabrotica virgifera virgifera TaxID=50390 RepID=A0ABM5IU61_DIAVI|nr:asparagine synthetase [glutamine-hydrolyzing] [Diabrotica virgifera virgifera]
MCGIWAVFGLTSNIHSHCASTFCQIGHRGPDAWRVEYDNKLKNCCIGFHRLAIVGCKFGMQPMKLHQYPHSMLICNGELYNFQRLGEQYDFDYETRCDVECIFHLYEKFGIEECVKNLDGVFAFCLIDVPRRKVLLGRDPYGVRPLFKVISSSGVLGICSEAKGLVGIEKDLNGESKKIEPFPPGTFEEYDLLENGKVKLVRSQRYFSPGDRPSFKPFLPYEDLIPNDHPANIRKLLQMSVKKRLMAERKIGCMLSGGLDSSLIAALLVKEAKSANVPYKVQSFSIGMGDSPDLRAARVVAKHVGTDHHEVSFTEEDVAKVLDDVIYTLETPDITTIRASIPMYLISKYIQENTETTVLLSGEGADEIAQGYIYFRDAPSPQAAHEDSLRLLREIYLFDGLRADRTTASQSLELRVPFLDLQFTDYYLNLEKTLKQPKNNVEKYLLRSAFDGTDLLPHEILWRHKEAFSDGVASNTKSLFVIIQEIIDKRMPEPFDLEKAKHKYPHCTPTTKEAYYYREVFEKSYPKLAQNFLPYYWMPRWCEGVTDPSARFIKHYAADEKPEINGH